jgi:hypothetical protein
MTKESVKTECSSCRGTGVYHGFAEPPGIGVMCVNCNGTGCCVLEYTPFTAMKRRNDIKQVACSRGTFIGTGVGPVGDPISYDEFFNGKRP